MSEVKHSDLPWRIDCSESSSNYGATIITSSKVKAKKVAARLGGPDRDANAAFIVKACNTHDQLVAALDGMVMVCGRTGSSLEDFEEQAEAFYQETHFMRPGKSMPMGAGGEHDDDIRRDKFNAWVKSKIAAGRTALASLKEG